MSSGREVLRDLGHEVVDRQTAGVVVQLADGRVIDHNAAAVRVLQMTSEQLLGASSLDPTWEAVTPLGDPIDGANHPAMRAVQSGAPVEGFVMGVRIGGGEFRWLRVDAWPTTVEGQPAVLTQFADVTDTIDAERALTDGLERLQRHVLPPVDPDIPGVEVHTRYRSVVELLQVGGDFCDVYRVNHSRFGFFIGDAAGHDLDTVATTMIAHHTLRATGLHMTRPGRVLEWLHRTLLASADSVYCSAVHGALRLNKQTGVSVEFANAGHPRPIHISGGRAVVIDEAGSIVGALDDFDEPPSVTLALPPGDMLVLYTDGLLESAVPRLTTEEFATQLERAPSIDDVLAVVDELMLASTRHDSEETDDTAVLVFHVDEPA